MPKDVITEVDTPEVQQYFVDAFARDKTINPQVVAILFELWLDRERAKAVADHARPVIRQALREVAAAWDTTGPKMHPDAGSMIAEWIEARAADLEGGN